MSRKISTDAIEAFYAGEPRSLGNTRIERDGDAVVLLLHDNPIARRSGDKLEIRTAGWPTVTTKERLNALPGVQVHSARGVLYLNGQPWDDHVDWSAVTRRPATFWPSWAARRSIP